MPVNAENVVMHSPLRIVQPGYLITPVKCASFGVEIKIKNMTDKELFKLCCEYGAKARRWNKKFASLLPEVEKRELWKKHKMYSIYEFAAKLAGMSRETVDAILNVGKNLEDKPKLREQMVEEGWSKLRVVANIATPQTDEFWAKQVEILPKKALELLVREKREVDVSSKSPKPVPGDKEWSRLSFTVKPETELKLRNFRKKLEKERKETISFGEALEILLEKTEESPKKIRKSKGTTGRPVSAKKKHEVHNNGQCMFPGCNKPHEEYHHPDRYAITGNHDRIVSLCHEHHQLAHAGYIENEHDPPDQWRLRDNPRPNTIDLKCQEHVRAKSK